MRKRTEVPFYLPTLQWQKHLPAARLLLSNSALSSQLICSQSNLQNLHQLLHIMTTAQDLLLCKFHIFFRGCTMKSPMLAKLFFANNLYFPYTHPRRVFPWNAAFHYTSHTQILSCSITTSPSATSPTEELMDQGAGSTQKELPGSNRHQCNLRLCTPDGRTRDIPKPDPLVLLLVSLLQKTLTIFKGATEGKLGQQNEPRAGIP